MEKPFGLPVDSILALLRRALTAGTGAVLQAPPGSGKTTCIPLALHDEPWLKGSRIIMLEPRRLAARAAANRMASMLGQESGGTVGYRIRRETKVGPETRIEVVTEGILTRMLQADQEMAGTGLIIFDEFHERSLHADLGLALALDVQQALRDDLRILIMSATMDSASVARLLGNVPVITGEGRLFEVETRWIDRQPRKPLEAEIAGTVIRALTADPGSVLVFLPGEGEIRRTADALAGLSLPADVEVMPLYGSLSRAEQDRAIEPAGPGRRKAVLATSIAETSLTIDGVAIVVDSGLMRVPRFSPRTAITRLETVAVTKASAEQRRGRAGRTGPGVCYRMWSREHHEQLQDFLSPEIRHADLASLALELALWGETDASRLSWLDPPPAGALAQAAALLQNLDALDSHGRITAHGRRLAMLPLHPRLAHMIVKGADTGMGAQACLLASLLNERDILRFPPGEQDADIRLRLDALTGTKPAGAHCDGAAVRRIRDEAEDFRRRLDIPPGKTEPEAAGRLLAFAYPDRIALRRGPEGGYLLSSGKGADFPRPEPLSACDWLAVAHLTGGQRSARIFLAAPYSREELEEQFAGHLCRESTVAWDCRTRAVLARSLVRYGSLVLEEKPLAHPDSDETGRALLEGIAAEGIGLLPWTRELRAWQARILFLRRVLPEDGFPDVSDEALTASMAEWLLPFITGMSRADHLRRLPLKDALHTLVPRRLRQRIEEHAPTHIAVPSGSRIPLDYSADVPVLAVRLQELFGLQETPRIASGRVPVLLHLLSPAGRPAQVTHDLAGFWRTTYFEVKKELLARYPRHHWPDDPLAAQPTSRAKRKKR